jgi:SAM-dependent methyltransferase
MTTLNTNSPTTEMLAASEGAAWEKSPYYENAESLLWVFWRDDLPFLPLFRQLDLSHLVELACGHGRHSEHVLTEFGERVKSLVMMDILQSNIDWCLKRIRARENVKCLRNNGTGFHPLKESSITAIFCYDAMVHFHRDVVLSYLSDARRVLVPGGKALLHHSNYAKDADLPFTKHPHSRGFMSASLFQTYAEYAALEVVSQQILPWGGQADLDCVTLLRKP